LAEISVFLMVIHDYAFFYSQAIDMFVVLANFVGKKRKKI